jgi:hypothetical protein
MPRPKWGRKAASGLLIAAMILSMIITTPVFAEGAAPNHISAVMTESPQDSVMIAWETSDTTVTQTVVEVVKAADEAQFDSAEVMTYSDGSISIAGSRAYSKVLVTGLEAGTEYYYRCRNDSSTGWSEVGRFVTAPDTREAFTFVYLSDLQINSTNDAEKTKVMLDHLNERFGDESAFTLITGDFTDSSSQAQWDTLFQIDGDRFSKSLTVPTIGNHDSFGSTNYLKLNFPDPPDRDGDPTNGIAYTYAFEYGAALFMVINVNGDLQAIADWVEDQVAKSDKPWQIVAFHEAIYTAGSHISGTSNARKILSPVFDRVGIDLVLQGHDHTYSRSIVNGDGSIQIAQSVDGSRNNVFDPEAPVYYQTVSGANKFYSPASSYSISPGDPLLPNYGFIDYMVNISADAASADGNKMCYTGITVCDEKITLSTYYTTTKTFKTGLLETYTIYSRNPAYVPKGSRWKYLDDGTD